MLSLESLALIVGSVAFLAWVVLYTLKVSRRRHEELWWAGETTWDGNLVSDTEDWE